MILFFCFAGNDSLLMFVAFFKKRTEPLIAFLIIQILCSAGKIQPKLNGGLFWI